MAAQIVSLKREGKQAEAKALSDGFSKLLDKLSSEPGLPVSVQRFLGQSLIIVGEFDKAVEALKKVPPPAKRELLFKANDPTLDAADKKTVNEFRRAALELLRAYRQSKKFIEADASGTNRLRAEDHPALGQEVFKAVQFNAVQFIVLQVNVTQTSCNRRVEVDRRETLGGIQRRLLQQGDTFSSQVENEPSASVNCAGWRDQNIGRGSVEQIICASIDTPTLSRVAGREPEVKGTCPRNGSKNDRAPVGQCSRNLRDVQCLDCVWVGNFAKCCEDRTRDNAGKDRDDRSRSPNLLRNDRVIHKTSACTAETVGESHADDPDFAQPRPEILITCWPAVVGIARSAM